MTLPEGDRGDDPALLDALDKLIHVLVQLHLKGVLGKIVNLREGNIINARELVFLSLRVIHEKLIVPGQTQIDFLLFQHIQGVGSGLAVDGDLDVWVLLNEIL